jgi:NitT/TauT family transport system substrate-binding protein
MRVAIALVVAGFAGLLGAWPATAQPALEKITISTGGKALFYSLHYIAGAEGFYKQEGLAVESMTVMSGTQQAASVMGGSADVTLIGLEQIIHADSQNGELVAIATCYNAFPYDLVLANDVYAKSGITPGMSIDEKVKRLHGLRIGISAPSTAGDVFLRTLFRMRGMNPDAEVKLQPVGAGAPMYAAFQQGIVQGFLFGPPYPQMAVGRKLGSIAISAGSGEVPEYRNTVFLVVGTSRGTLARERPLLAKTVRALTRAIKFAHENPDAARRDVRAEFKEVQEDDFNMAFDSVLKDLPTTPLLSPAQIDGTETMINLTESPPIKLPYSVLVVPDMAVEAAAQILGK